MTENNTAWDEVLDNDEMVENDHSLAILPPADESIPKPWEMQPWDTVYSFQRFNDYYLLQDPPHTLIAAYRLYRLKTGLNQAYLKRLRSLSSAWARWAYARNGNNEPIDGALTWEQRANAFDRHRMQRYLRELEQTWGARRQELREAEWKIGTAAASLSLGTA